MRTSSFAVIAGSIQPRLRESLIALVVVFGALSGANLQHRLGQNRACVVLFHVEAVTELYIHPAICQVSRVHSVPLDNNLGSSN